MRKEEWEDIDGWNITATISLIAGVVIGYYNEYKYPIGIPPLQIYVLTGVIYYVAMRIKAAIAPDRFTPESWIAHKHSEKSVE